MEARDTDEVSRKEIDTKLGELKLLKTRADGVANAYLEIMSKVSTDPAGSLAASKVAELSGDEREFER